MVFVPTSTAPGGGGGGGSGSLITKGRLGRLKQVISANGVSHGFVSQLQVAIQMEFSSPYWGDAAFSERDWLVLYQFVRKQRRFDRQGQGPTANQLAEEIRRRHRDVKGRDF